MVVWGRLLPVGFYARDTRRVARELLGCVLETTIGGARTAGRIVEVEAYLGPHDPADHGYGWRLTRRNARLFGPPGTCYVYLSYGMHWCANVVTERDGYPSAVLIRALEPLAGLEIMRARRGTDDLARLCAGPGRLCQALGITGALDGSSLQGPEIRIFAPGAFRRGPMVAGPRVGISRGTDWPLRFALRGSRWVSRPLLASAGPQVPGPPGAGARLGRADPSRAKAS